MANADLSNYDLGGLKALLGDIQREIDSRQNDEVRKAREQILSIAKSVGIRVEQLVSESRKNAKGETKSKVTPQYRNPASSEQTWTGRGRKPAWVVDALAKGKKLDDLRI